MKRNLSKRLDTGCRKIRWTNIVNIFTITMMILVLSACNLPAPSRPIACADDLRAIWDEFPQFGNMTLEPGSMSHRPWACDVWYETAASIPDLLTNYEQQLIAHGWTIERDYNPGNNIFAHRDCLSYRVLTPVSFIEEVSVTLSSAGTIADVVKRGSIPPPDAGPLALVLDGELKTIFELLQASGLETMLMEDGPFTFFAPIQDAFNVLSDAQQRQLMQNPELLKQTIMRHIVPYAIDDGKLEQLAKNGSLPVETLAGDNVTLYFDGYHERSGRSEHRLLLGFLPEIAFFHDVKINGQYAQLRVNDAALSLNMAGPTQACNGVVYMIDRVLIEGE
ncbi:MAG: fasciclin domain-containing protein [Chloroflexota bacterium]